MYRNEEVRLMNMNHAKFAESLRSIIRNVENTSKQVVAPNNVEEDEETKLLRAMLEERFEELFGSTDDSNGT